MKLALIYIAFLATIVCSVWIAARKAARAEKELEHARQQIQDRDNAGEILNNYINMSSQQLTDSVQQHRKTYNKRMHGQD